MGRASPRAPGTRLEGAAAPCCACSPGGPGHPQFSHPQNSVFSTAPWGRKTPPSFPVYGHSVHGGWVLTRSHHVLPKPDEGDEASRTAQDILSECGRVGTWCHAGRRRAFAVRDQGWEAARLGAAASGCLVSLPRTEDKGLRSRTEGATEIVPF